LPVANYQTFMAPALRALEDGQPRSRGQICDAVAEQLGITAADRAEMLPSKKARVFDSRVGWALTYMVQAALIERPRRAMNQITKRGLDVLREHPDRVDNHVLEAFEEFRDFRARSARVTEHKTQTASTTSAQPSPDPTAERTPQEVIATAVEEVNSAVAAEILARVRRQDPAFLENLVLKVLTAMGYAGAAGSAEHLGRSGDEGLDGVIKQDKLGLDRIYVQAKRYAAERTVGRPDIQGFVGALHGAQADRGVFITTSRFSPDALSYADKVNARVILIDGLMLASLLVEHNIGAQDDEAFVLKRIDEDFFEET
jgi:restriction system protein